MEDGEHIRGAWFLVPLGCLLSLSHVAPETQNSGHQFNHSFSLSPFNDLLSVSYVFGASSSVLNKTDGFPFFWISIWGGEWGGAGGGGNEGEKQ